MASKRDGLTAHMLVLDTNHTTELAYRSAVGERLRDRLRQARDSVFTTVIIVEEELRGVLAMTKGARDDTWRILAYREPAGADPHAGWCGRGDRRNPVTSTRFRRFGHGRGEGALTIEAVGAFLRTTLSRRVISAASESESIVV